MNNAENTEQNQQDTTNDDNQQTIITQDIPNNILALASIIQTSALVNELATKGQCDAQSCDISIASLTKSSNNVADMYSNEDLIVGLSALKKALQKANSHKNILLYSLSLIKLEKILMKDSAMLGNISGSIDEITKNTYFDIHHETNIAKFATIYKNSVGLLKPKILINGDEKNLRNQNIVNHIRALLLAGVRSVSLWRNNGGNLWQLVLNKKKILQQLKGLQI